MGSMMITPGLLLQGVQTAAAVSFLSVWSDGTRNQGSTPFTASTASGESQTATMVAVWMYVCMKLSSSNGLLSFIFQHSDERLHSLHSLR